MFTLYPSLHIKEGTVSRLTRSSSDSRQAMLIDRNPVERAQKFAAEGFEWLHIIDLDAAFSTDANNMDCIQKMMKAVKIPAQVSGGMRDMKTIEKWFELGAGKVIITSAAQQDPKLVHEAATKFPGRILVKMDSIGGYVTRTGWHTPSATKALDLALRVEEAGAAGIIFADINLDGALSEIDMEATVDLAFSLTIPVIAAGGVYSLQDLAKLKSHSNSGIQGLIMGGVLYNGTINAQEALKLVREP